MDVSMAMEVPQMDGLQWEILVIFQRMIFAVPLFQETSTWGILRAEWLHVKNKEKGRPCLQNRWKQKCLKHVKTQNRNSGLIFDSFVS